MNRLARFAFALCLLAAVGTPARATPDNQHYDCPDPWQGSGDDDQPLKTLPANAPSPESMAAPSPMAPIAPRVADPQRLESRDRCLIRLRFIVSEFLARVRWGRQ
jgi:hypothetical protein